MSAGEAVEPVIFGGRWKESFGAIWPGRLMRTWIRGPQLSPLHDPDDERFACRLDDLAGDDRKVVDVQDPLDLGY